MPQQPEGMLADNGCVLTVGVEGLTQTFEIVQPMGTESTLMDGSNRCKDCVDAFFAIAAPDLAAIMSSGVYIAFLEARGMINGSIPYRKNLLDTDLPGTREGIPTPTQVCALGVYYEDPEDVVGTQKIRVAKTFFGGISVEDTNEDVLITALINLIQAYIDEMQAGYPSIVDAASNWYRVLAVPKPAAAGTVLRRTIEQQARGYVYTQRRRLTPRF